MDPLSAHLKDHLRWVQPQAMRRSYELQGGRTVLGALRFEVPFDSLATGQTTEGLWSFKCVDALRRIVTVRVKGTRHTLATYHSRFGGRQGELCLYDGTTFSLRAANFWTTRYEIYNRSGETLIAYRLELAAQSLADMIKTQADVEITAQGRALGSVLDLLLVSGWYLLILEKQHLVVIAATVATTAGAT